MEVCWCTEEMAEDKGSAKCGGRLERARKRVKERADQSCFSRFLLLLIPSSGRLCDASCFIQSHSSLALVSFGEIHCPPWAVYMPTRQPGSLHNQATQGRGKKSFSSNHTCSFTCSSSLLSLIVSLSPLYPFLFLLSSLCELYLEINVFSFFLSEELFVLQGQVQSTLAKLYSQPDSL